MSFAAAYYLCGRCIYIVTRSSRTNIKSLGIGYRGIDRYWCIYSYIQEESFTRGLTIKNLGHVTTTKIVGILIPQTIHPIYLNHLYTIQYTSMFRAMLNI